MSRSGWPGEVIERRLIELRDEWRMWQDPDLTAAYRERRLREIADEGRYLSGDRDSGIGDRLADRLHMPALRRRSP